MATHTVIPTSSIIFGWNYDVTLSYIEEEETTGMNNFIGKLYASLKKVNFKTFKDNNPERGEQMTIYSETLKKGIEGSRCAVIIFSRNYASSTRCLEEVALMMECRNTFGQTVFPVFLMDVEGSDVRRQKGCFEEPFRKHEQCFNQKVVERWRSALKLAGELSGLNFKDIPDGDEEKLIAKIVKDVSHVLSEIPSPNAVIEMQTETITENQPSTQRKLQEILDCIADPKIDIIGLYGLSGVGKTILAREVNNHFHKELSRGKKIPFEIVIMVTVSPTPNARSIQTSIGKRLGLHLSEDSEDGAREKLFDVLRRRKFLLIFDDVSSKLKIVDFGIPHPRKHKGGKILVTSWSEDACTNTGATKSIEVRPLSKDESWNLFVEVAGQHVADVAGIEYFARKIVGRCKGLPLAIVTVARAMANRHKVGSWENALREMELSSSELRGMKEEVFAPLKSNFDKLENDMLRNLFLYCACFPEDYDIGEDEILNYCVGEGLLDKPRSSLKAIRDKGVDLIETLKIAGMLKDGKVKGTVRMRGMMRELALWITSSTYCNGSYPKFLVMTEKSFKEAPPANEWVDVTRVSLTHSGIAELTELYGTCWKLTTLMLRGSSICSVPSTNFFKYMYHLSILDLSDTNLELLPMSVSLLKNLRVLRLQKCRLKILPTLGNFPRLQVLDLYYCTCLKFQILVPEDMECVRNLRYLNVEGSSVCIREEVFPHMQKLEEARFYGAREIEWRVDPSRGKGQRKQQQQEEEDDQVCRIGKPVIDVWLLLDLKYLRCLSIEFVRIRISEDWFSPLVNKIKKLKLRSCIVAPQDLLSSVASQNLEEIELDSCLNVSEVRMAAISTILRECDGLVTVFDNNEVFYGDGDSIRMLHLNGLPKLITIDVPRSPLSHFAGLSHITIERCHSLKKIFTAEMPRLFNNLETITVTSCRQMKVIFEGTEEEEEEEEDQLESLEEEGKEDQLEGLEEEEEDDQLESLEEEEEEEEFGEFIDRPSVISTFPKLRKLRLEDLPALHGICSRNYVFECPYAIEVEVYECPRLKGEYGWCRYI